MNDIGFSGLTRERLTEACDGPGVAMDMLGVWDWE